MISKKQKLRKKYFQLRKRKYFEIKSNFFNPFITLIKKKYKKKKIKLSIYYPTSFEVNVFKIFQIKDFKNIELYLPVIYKNNFMKFHKWELHEVLSINKYGLLEPTRSNLIDIPDIIFVPLLAYDNQKNRLGYGGGFYDRYLKKYLKKNRNIITIGIAFSFQNCGKVPTSNHDVKLNYILSEKGMI